MSRVHVRCRCCDARRVLKDHPESFFKWDKKEKNFVNKAPACDNCGKQDWRVDGWMNRRDTSSTRCLCSGYVHLTRKEWPHRIGSKYCWFRSDGTQRMEGDRDFHDSQMEEYFYNQEKEIA